MLHFSDINYTHSLFYMQFGYFKLFREGIDRGFFLETVSLVIWVGVLVVSSRLAGWFQAAAK